MSPNLSVKQLSKFLCRRVPEPSSLSPEHMIKMTFPAARGGLGAISPCVSLLGREFGAAGAAGCCVGSLAADSVGAEPGVRRVA